MKLYMSNVITVEGKTMQHITPWYVPVLLALGVFSMIGSIVCLGLHFVVSNEYDRVIYLAGFLVFLVTAFFALGLGKVSQMLYGITNQRQG